MKDQLKTLLGKLLITLEPRYATELGKEGMNVTSNEGMSIKDRLIRHSLLKNAEGNGDFDMLAEYHHDFWLNKGQNHFSSYDDTLNGFFLPKCAFIFEELQSLLSQNHMNFDTMVEIGTGHGDVLNYLSSKFTNIDRFVGIDLSAVQIKVIKKKYEDNPKLEFVAADAFDWIKENGRDKTIFFTSGGVLEYFTEKRLQNFFDYLNNLGSIIFIAIEPMGADIDFAEKTSSQPYGPERSFSHNYTKIFKNAGFKVWHESIIPYEAKTFNFWAIGAIN